MTSLKVFLLPTLVDVDDLRGSTAVVIDVLRATTTIAHALTAGAEKIVPFQSVEAAFDWKAKQAAAGITDVVLGGERGGVKIDGFDCGNSPADYTAEVVRGKQVGFTTTNGTRAMQHARDADRVLLASFANLSATIRELQKHDNVNILCSGTNGDVTREDALLAGAIVERLRTDNTAVRTNDQAQIVSALWTAASLNDSEADWLTSAIADSQGGRNLTQLGFTSDIALAATLDCIDDVLELNVPSWEVRLARSTT